MNNSEFSGLVTDVNIELHEEKHIEDVNIELLVTGFYECIRIRSCGVLWDSEDRDLRWIDDDNQEMMLVCLARRATKYAEMMSGVAKALRDMAEKEESDNK